MLCLLGWCVRHVGVDLQPYNQIQATVGCLLAFLHYIIMCLLCVGFGVRRWELGGSFDAPSSLLHYSTVSALLACCPSTPLDSTHLTTPLLLPPHLLSLSEGKYVRRSVIAVLLLDSLLFSPSLIIVPLNDYS